jgi:ribose transport system substrate-binding protein
MKKGIILLSVVMFVLMVFGGSMFGAEKIKIGVSIPSADHGWTGGIVWYAQQAIKDWQAKDSDIEFFLVTANGPAKQVGDVEDLMVKGIDALVILAHDSAPLTPIVEEAYKASRNRLKTYTLPEIIPVSAEFQASGWQKL